MKKDDKSLIPSEKIIQRIIRVREERVILDVHIAELYKVETRSLKQAVRRNLDRFPEDFMFELNEDEIDQVVSQNVIPSKSHFGGATPFAFTETGVAMLSSILKSKRAIETNISIIRTFVALRKLASNYNEILMRIEEMEKSYDKQFNEVFDTLKHLLRPKSKRNPIGFKKQKDQ
mgnify:CR=1 FL=1